MTLRQGPLRKVDAQNRKAGDQYRRDPESFLRTPEQINWLYLSWDDLTKLSYTAIFESVLS